MTHPAEQGEQATAKSAANLERRSDWMIRIGGLTGIVAFLAIGSGAAIGFLLALLGIALFVGGLIVRP